LEGSLQRLGVDFVDLYYVHRRDQTIPIEDVAGTLARFKEEGKIGGVGFSEISPASLTRAAAVHPIMAVQSEYSLWTRLPELGMLQECARQGAAFVAFSPVARGMFAEIMPDPADFPDGDFRKNNPRFLGANFEHNARLIGGFNDWARSRGWSPAAVALAWILHQGDHIIPIPGTRSPEHLLEDAAGADIDLSAGDLAEIEALLPVGFAHGDRYNDAQNKGPERYC
jgi:aryl-alcohol dehydrogenase-like predicted oxidoreductase